MIRLLADSSPGEVRIAVVIDDQLEEFALWRPGRPDGLGDIYRARVVAHVPGMAGAFVALPDGDGFLPDSEGGARAVEGAQLTVRITRAAQSGKGARVSARIPQSEGDNGLVAVGPTPFEELAARYPEAAITVGEPALAAQLRSLVQRNLPIVPGVLAPWAEEIEALSSREVDLPSGMRASIDPTPALVAIDLDMAAATAGRAAKPRAQLAANLAAIPALARQIRLRNLSGAILIDPAGLGGKRRQLLAPALTAAFAQDRLGPRLLGFTALGFAEVTRPRLRPPLHELRAGAHAAGLEALRVLARESAATPAVAFRLIAAPDLIAALDRDAVARADLARRTGRPFVAVSDPARPPGSWYIERDA